MKSITKLTTMTFQKIVIALHIVLAVTILLPSLSYAQNKIKKIKNLNEWIKVCDKIGKKNTQSICLISSEIMQENNHVGSIALREFTNSTTKKIIISLPLGLMLRPGIKFQIDDQEEISGKYTICFRNACYAEINTDENIVKNLKKGKKINLEVYGMNANVITQNISLNGFTKAYNGDPISEEELKERRKALEEELKQKASKEAENNKKK